MVLLLFVPLLHAESVHDTFSADSGSWEGGEVSEGVLVVEDATAHLPLDGATSLEATLSLRVVEGAVQVVAGDATWQADYHEGGDIAMGGEALPFPSGHRSWEADPDPVLTGGDEAWDAGDVLHCDVWYDGTTWFLFYTGAFAEGYGYRQIGLATSEDGETWTRWEDNPILTIDYSDDVDGVHVHMPSVVVHDNTWHLFYACYQNDVGNRICHATSSDGRDFTTQGVALDRGESGEFDSASLREPEVWVGDDGTWHMLYQGTQDDEHYGPTGYATSSDGTTWTRHGAINEDSSTLQGGGVVSGPYGLEQWYNCDDAFCYASAEPEDPTTWECSEDPVLTKSFADWAAGYVQAPSPWLLDTTYHMWFNAYDYGAVYGHEVIGHARTVPAPGEWLQLDLLWDGTTVQATMDDGPALTATTSAVDSLTIHAVGRVELDEAEVNWTVTEDTAPAEDTADPGDEADTDPVDQDSGEADPADTSDAQDQGGRNTDRCGCSPAAGPGGLLPVVLLGLWGRRRRRDRR